MTYAPQPLLDARAYLAQRTGLPWVSLGIVGSAGHHATGTSYHIGWSSLHDWAYSRQHPRDTKLRTEAASALDIGQFPGLVALTAHLVAEARAGRLPDVRAIIGPAGDGRAYRWDRHDSWRARQRARGDSHETHCHIEYYRDSEHRDKTAPFRRFFEEDDDMSWQEELQRPDGEMRPAGRLLVWGNWASFQSRDQARENGAKLDALLAAQAGEDVVAAVRAELERHRATLLATLGETLGEQVLAELREQLGDVADERLVAAAAAGVRRALGSLDDPA